MEYNIRSVLGVGQERPLGKDWFESCAHVPQGAERVCYFWQPTWWGHALRSADARLGSSAFKQMGDACRALKRGELRDGCFEGIGVSALNTGRSLADGISGCAEASEDPYAHALCITSIARYIALASVADQGRSVCLDLPALYKDMCVHDIENASPSSSYIGEKLLMEKAI